MQFCYLYYLFCSHGSSNWEKSRHCSQRLRPPGQWSNPWKSSWSRSWSFNETWTYPEFNRNY